MAGRHTGSLSGDQLRRSPGIVDEAWLRGRWLIVSLKPGYMLLLGECGGKALYHAPASQLARKYHLYLTSTDGSFLTATTQMWGAMELYEQGDEQKRAYVKGIRTTPIEPTFTFDYFDRLVDEVLAGK